MTIRFYIISAMIFSASIIEAQPTVGIYSFYLDKEVDFSLMQSFSDDSEESIQTLVEDPAFELNPLLTDFYDYFISTSVPIIPLNFLPEGRMTSYELYYTLENRNKYEKTKMYEPVVGYLALGNSFDESYLPLISNEKINGIMSVRLQFFVRKNMLKTVIQAQVTATIWNKEGKKAWNCSEFGISKIGFTTVSGFVVSKQDEVMPMFESAMGDLKEKMTGNMLSRSKNSAKKL